MDVQVLKEHILNNNLIEDVLDAIGCHSIHKHTDYYTCSNQNGDNKNAIVVYENENLTVINYTRQIAKNKRSTDIFDLVCYNKECTFPEALKYVCNLFGLDYYSEPSEIPESLQILQLLKEMSTGTIGEDNTPIKPIPEVILKYYLQTPNKMFEDDYIALDVQSEFEIGYDPRSNYITIPIRDETGVLVGVKGRYFGCPDDLHPKYFALEKFNKSRLLYGYYQNKSCIKRSQCIYVVESEKAVMQLASIGIRNVVSTGGKTISKTQIELITRTGCVPVFAFDKDVKEEELINISEMFMSGITIKAIIDKDDILNEKESPSDNPNKFIKLIENHVYTLKGEK